MKFEEHGEYKENLTIEIKPQEFIEHNLLKDLQNVLGYIKRNKPTILKKFHEQFNEKLKAQTKNHYSIKNKSKFNDLIKDYDYLINNQDLTKLSLNYFLEKLSLSENEFWENKVTNFPAKKFHNSANGFYYYQLSTLVDLLGKKDAILFYREILRNFIWAYDLNQKDIFESLEDYRERHIRFIDRGIFGRVRLISDVVNGKLITICKNCEKIDELDEFLKDEPDLLYNLACWVHIPLAELWNENFELVIEDCIAKGDPFCTYIYHDKRITNNLKHSTKINAKKIIKESS
jgi:hypothetical protein